MKCSKKIDFTARTVTGLALPAAGAKAVEYSDVRVRGLRLVITKAGAMSWGLRYKLHGRCRFAWIGTYPATSVQEARRVGLEMLGKIERGHDPTEERAAQRAIPTFSEFVAEKYLPWAEINKRSYKGEVSKMNVHLLPKFGRRRLTDITTHDIEMHHGTILAASCASTANHHLSLLSMVFKQAIRWQAIPGPNPCIGVGRSKVANGKERYLAADEIKRLYAAMDAESNKVVVSALKLLLLTGVRLGEALNAKHDDLDLGNGTWRLPKTKNGRVRHVVLSSDAKELLESLPSRGTSPWLFPGRKAGQPLNNPRKCFERVLSAAGIEGHVRLHDLRHAYASIAVNSGVSLFTVQHLLGHQTPAMTQRYSHMQNETLQRGTQTVADAISAAVRGSAAA